MPVQRRATGQREVFQSRLSLRHIADLTRGVSSFEGHM
eukprot:CAMPEP_0203894832 /NCGR_PEP_ID=MMETSP0359-20131031/37740_1 /ASSEMBLY_ACC=CAM_ASM_000338 /TAXON_ID=268821 /ORGANISM="Scrippsiella Hangoei, Strain SHTV-5" /LENGTH=37 /DNA_ID= /DNA_START= /DNA_END= /DNA_ORIENTATION=